MRVAAVNNTVEACANHILAYNNERNISEGYWQAPFCRGLRGIAYGEAAPVKMSPVYGGCARWRHSKCVAEGSFQ